MIISSRGDQTANLIQSSPSQHTLQASSPFFSAGCPPSYPHFSAFRASLGLQNLSNIEAAILVINQPSLNARSPPQCMPAPPSLGHQKRKAKSIIRIVNWRELQNFSAEIMPSYLTRLFPWPQSLRERPSSNEPHERPTS